jgi:sec-independent protein translocase protein TatA
MFNLGSPELLIVLALVVIVFGVGKLPQVGGALGRGIREFRDASEGHGTAAGTTANAPAPVERSQE